jgi:NAD(P)H-flavin reductase
MDFELKQDAWRIGEHFYLCFTECSIWQSHPFTPLSLPEVKDGLVAHSYLLRAKGGETRKMANLAAKKLAQHPAATTPLILSGPYGENIMKNLTSDVNVLCVAGGTGITYVLPVLLSLIHQPSVVIKDRKIELVWAVRKKADLRWIEQELSELREASHTHGVVVRVFITRESTPAPSLCREKAGESSSESLDGESNVEVRRLGSSDSPDEQDRHPDLKKIVKEFVDGTVRGPTAVFASGPGGMISDLRSVVAARNDGARVWRGEERFDVRLVCDDRLEW